MAKYRDIPKYIHCNYAVDQPIDMMENTLQRYAEMGLDLDPDFQRAHVWTPEQKSRYVEFLFREGQSGRDLYFNCVGWMASYKGPFVIVDGKQRLQAIRDFLADKVRIFGSLRSEYEGKVPPFLTVKFHINNLRTRKEVLQWYHDLNAGGTVHTNDELDKVRRLLEAEG